MTGEKSWVCGNEPCCIILIHEIRTAKSIDKKLKERGTFRQQTQLFKGRGFLDTAAGTRRIGDAAWKVTTSQVVISHISVAKERCHHTSVDKLSENRINLYLPGSIDQHFVPFSIVWP